MRPAYDNSCTATTDNVDLLIDALKEANEKQADLLVVYSKWYPDRKQLIEKLFIIADKMDEVDKNRLPTNLGILGGSSVSLSGSICSTGAIIGLFNPIGLSMALLATAVGSTISVVSSLKQIGLSKEESDEIQNLIEKDKEKTENLFKALLNFTKTYKTLQEWIDETNFTDKELRNCADAIKMRQGTISPFALIAATSTYAKKCIKHSDNSIVKVFTEILESIGLAFDFSHIKAKMLSSKRLEMDDILTLGFGITIKTCIPPVSIIIDIMTIYKVLDDFKKGSKSEDAANMRTLAKQYREGQTDMKNIMNKVFPSRNN